MSKTETLQELNAQILVGFEEKRGKAWWWRKGLQGGKPNHYTGAVPVEDVIERLFHWDCLEGSSVVTCISKAGVLVVEDKKRKALVRSDTGEIFGYFSGQPGSEHGYNVNQFRDGLIGRVQAILGDDVQIGSAGLLKLGAVAWVSVEAPENFKTPEGVEFRPFITATSSHDGSVANTYFDSVLLPICDNTLAAASHESGQMKFKAKHTRFSEDRIDSYMEASGLIEAAAMQFEQQVKELCAIDVSESQFEQWLEKTFPAPAEANTKGSKRKLTIAMDKRGTLMQLWTADARVKPWKNTAFGVLQAMNTATQHEFVKKNDTADDKAERNMMKTINGEFVAVDRQSMKTLQLVLS